MDTQILKLEVCEVNKKYFKYLNPNVTLCSVFLGGLGGSEAIPLNAAFGDTAKKYDEFGVEIYFEKGSISYLTLLG